MRLIEYRFLQKFGKPVDKKFQPLPLSISYDKLELSRLKSQKPVTMELRINGKTYTKPSAELKKAFIEARQWELLSN